MTAQFNVVGLRSPRDLFRRTDTPRVDRLELGITGTPTFVFDKRFAVVGAQPIEALLQAIDAALKHTEIHGGGGRGSHSILRDRRRRGSSLTWAPLPAEAQ